MALVKTGPGKVTPLSSMGGTARGRLYNFDVDGARLKHEHEVYLRTHIVPALRSGGSVRLIGLASRTGGAEHNRALSQQRIAAVLAFLRGGAGQAFQVAEQEAEGEEGARLAGVRDGVEGENWRATIVSAWMRPTPPPPPSASEPPPVMLRTVQRSWMMPPQMRARNVSERGSEGAALGELFLRMINPDAAEKNPVYMQLPETYAINRISLTRKTTENQFATGDTYYMTYEWGPPQETVELVEYDAHRRRVTREQARPWIETPGKIVFRGERREPR